MHCFLLPFEQIGQIYAEDVDDSHARGGRDNSSKRLLMRIMSVRGEQNELTNARCLPRIDQIVEYAVKGLFSQRRVAGEAALGIDVDSVLRRRSAQHAIFRGQIVSHALDDDGIASERHMRTVLLACADRDDESRIVAEDGCDLRRIELLYAKRPGNWNWGGKRHRISG